MKADLRPRLELNNSCCTDLTGTSALGIFTHITKTEVASSPEFLPARMSDYQHASFLGRKSAQVAKSIRSIIPAFSGIVSENNYFSEKNKEIFQKKRNTLKRNATLIKPCLQKRKTISTFIRCCLYTSHKSSFCYC